MHLPMPQVSNSFFPFNPSLEEELKRLFANFSLVDEKDCTPNVEDIMEEFRHNGRDFEYCSDGDNYVPKSSSRRKKKKQQPTECVFCRNNGEEEEYYRQHMLKDANGRILCPVLRAYTCPICGACGDAAHTVKYCPKGIKNVAALSNTNTLKFKCLRNSVGRRRYN